MISCRLFNERSLTKEICYWRLTRSTIFRSAEMTDELENSQIFRLILLFRREKQKKFHKHRDRSDRSIKWSFVVVRRVNNRFWERGSNDAALVEFTFVINQRTFFIFSSRWGKKRRDVFFRSRSRRSTYFIEKEQFLLSWLSSEREKRKTSSSISFQNDSNQSKDDQPTTMTKPNTRFSHEF